MKFSGSIAALAPALVSRAMLFGLLVIGSQIAYIHKIHSGTVWETRITFDTRRVLPGLTAVGQGGDAWSYRTIAVNGYGARGANGEPHGTWAFFPLYPLLVRSLPFTGEFALDGMLISNVCFLAAMLLLFSIVTRDGGSTDDASRAVVYLAFFPVSYFLSLPLPESLFLLLAAGAFATAQRGQWWAAGLLAALASATRVSGILLFPALLLFALEYPPRRRRQLFWLALAPAGLIGYMAFLNSLTGNALAFVEAQQLWGRRATFFLQPLFAYAGNWREMSGAWNLSLFHFLVTMLLLTAGVALLVRRRWAFGVFTLLMVLVPLTSGSLQSMARYSLGAFPMFIWLARIGANPLADRIITAVLVVLYGWFIAFLTLRVDFAIA